MTSHDHELDPSAAAASRRAEFLGMRRAAAEYFLWLSRIPAEFFKRSSQPNIFRRKFAANIQRSLNETVYIKIHILASCVIARCV